jgi:hypothetical protein
LTANTKLKPQVVGIDNINVELAPSNIYSGMYGRVTIRFFGYSNSGNKGIGCGLGNILKTRDGEPLAGNTSAASDFAGIGSSAMPPQTNTAPFQWDTAGLAYQPQAQQAYPQAQQAYPQFAASINPLTGQPL